MTETQDHRAEPHLQLQNEVGQAGQIGRMSVSSIGRYGDSDLAGSNPGRVKPMTLKLIRFAS